MKLVFYSGYDEGNATLDAAVAKLVGKKNPRVTFIPSAFYVPDYELMYFTDTFKDLGITDIHVFNVDQPYSPTQEAEALSSDMIYLSGGNTFYFLRSLKQHGFFYKLKQYAHEGRLLAGLSAGAIIMTPVITTASYPSFDRDDNKVGLKKSDWEGLNLCQFEFFPHYDREPEYARELIKQSKKIPYPIFAASDGAGIIKEDDQITFVGDVWCYVKGKEIKF